MTTSPRTLVAFDPDAVRTIYTPDAADPELEGLGALAWALRQLGRTCPDPWVVDATDRLTAALADLRSHLTTVVTEAYQGAVAAEQWIASLERMAS
ncbi:hypothetical protein [Sphaerisporangium fuscum]|uniref:hypothetical protein n=1 Tax=Sphaerisporangium fuscum TaxID=2835868 RepID=UPI001BDCFD19|nr:hypothetical protein [Sphaerisporangium fuscum]